MLRSFSMSGSSWFGLLSWAKWGRLLRDPNWEPKNPQNHGKHTTNLWWTFLFSKSCIFLFGGENPVFLHICSLFKSYSLNLFVFQIWKTCSSINPLQQSPQQGGGFIFISSPLPGEMICQVCLNLNKNGELVFFVGPVVWVCRIPENESGIVTEWYP